MKRTYSEQSDLVEEASSSSMFHLKSQNRALSLEMLRYKRQLSEARKELDLIRGKSREMESLVSIIQRAWSQLDMDASMLLDGFGDTEQLADAGGNTELLFRLMHAGSNFHSLDPTDMTGLPKLLVDEWSSAEDIDKAIGIATKTLRAHSSERSVASKSGSDNSIDREFGGKVDETLRGHASFTLTLLERLCFVLSDSGLLNHLPDSLGAIADAKALHAEIFALKDRTVKLSCEIVKLRAQLHTCEQKRNHSEKALDRAVTEHSRQIANGFSNSSSADGNPSSSLESGPGSDPVNDADGVKDMSLKITILERQLAESEGAKAKAEMTLTERLARPLSQTEAQVADMRRAMEDLRHQGRQRVTSLISEGAALQERVSDLEVAIMALETSCEQRCALAVATATSEIKAAEEKKEEFQASLFAAQADISTTNQLKLQVGELSILESSARSECLKLQQHIASISASQERLQTHLSSSRVREIGYEVRLGLLESAGGVGSGVPNGQAPSSSSGSGNSYGKMSSSGVNDNGSLHIGRSPYDVTNSSSSLQSDSFNGADNSWRALTPGSIGLNPLIQVSTEADTNPLVVPDNTEEKGDPPHLREIAMLTLRQAQERARETQIELDEARASLNDLILEIESVSVEEARSREQSARILRQMADSQAMQRGVLEENLKLQEQIAEMKSKQSEVENRIEIIQSVMKQQDSLILQLRAAEQSARTDVRGMKKMEAEESSNRHRNEQLLVEAEQKIKLAEYSVETSKKRNFELQSRCDELSMQWEMERKLRMEAQREQKSKVVKKEKNGSSNSNSSNSGHLNHEDAAMLEMTLGMLRCSVCKDRFKEVALTRCFHLFCKECIEENLRNRHRKCPACGDKFGQDDVKSIFFTD